jgi:hypothetical protein
MFLLTIALSSLLGDKFAYLDPGSGSLLLQLLIAVLLGAGVALRAFRGKIKRLFGIKSEEEEDDGEDEN